MSRQSTPGILGGVLADDEQLSPVALKWDYDQAGADGGTVRQHALAIKRHEAKAAQAIIAAGAELEAVKALLPHGLFLDWLSVEFGWTVRTAQRMMEVAREFGGKSDNLSHLGASVIYLIAADSTPEPARQAVIEAGANGKVSVAQAKAIIAAHKPPQPPVDAELVHKHGYQLLHHPPPPYGDDSVDVLQADQQIGAYLDQERADAAAQRDLAPQRDDAQPAQLAPPLPDASADSSLGEAQEQPLPDWLVAESELLTAVPALPVSQREGYDSDEWYTPAWVIAAARAVLGQIDLDPASCAQAQEVVKAGHYWVREDDSLQQAWHGRVWLNPPYSAPEDFITKLQSEYSRGHVRAALVLLNNATETKWFQLLLGRFPVCFLNRRLAFWRHDHADVGARQGQAVFYLGPDQAEFERVFGQYGVMVQRMS